MRLRLAPRLAERGRRAPPQIGLSRQQRPQNVPGALTLVEPEAAAGRELLLLDDVFTSAATVPGGPRIFGRAGASRVSAATRARTLNRDAAQLKPGRKLDARRNMARAG
jgi:predicted amidophosphoribosyltransferase